MASSTMPGTFAFPIFTTGISCNVLGGASYWPGPGRQSLRRLRPREPRLASALTFRAFRCSRSWSFKANSVSMRSTSASFCPFISCRLCSLTRSMRSLLSLTSVMCKCCCSLRIIRDCCSLSRLASTSAILRPSSTSFLSPSSRFSICRCSAFLFMASTFSLNTAALSLASCPWASFQRSMRSSSASTLCLNLLAFSSNSFSCLARRSAFFCNRSSVFDFTSLPSRSKCC
mmetsp:Transcript_2821/g.8481  ORF Transcript_2821/g.8481 Transcript_2821/m.8481 type:complete len:230 (+) Transcript_2821:335-1024(+)